MLPRDKSVTTSFKSVTNERSGLNTPVQFVKGVGPKLGAVFSSRGIQTVKDLLTFFPRAYEDRSRLLRISELTDGEGATTSVQIISSRKIPLRHSGRSMLEVRCSDDTGTLSLKWFHVPKGMESRFLPGTRIIVTGKVKYFMNRPEIVHPEITWSANAQAANVGRIVPLYTEIEGIPSRTFRKILWEALEKYGPAMTEDLPGSFLKTHGLPSVAEAVRMIHFPPENLEGLISFNTPAHWRLIYEEFFKFEYLVLRKRLNMRKEVSTAVGNQGGRSALEDLERSLPFSLTSDQKKALGEIIEDMGASHPMNRLLQGDVGSGKTAIAFLSAGMVLAEGGQAALMAPTEILAEQHFANAMELLKGKLKVGLLTGKTPASERAPLLRRLQSGEPCLLIGTHALLEDPVMFKNLLYVMIDEQHRFGVEQRRILRLKGCRKDETTGRVLLPHSLILTATPIPRTLALTAYGDLSVSTIREMPPGRTPVKTHVVRGDAKDLAYERIRDELKKGHQAYFICPLVNDSEAEGFTLLKSAVAESERLASEVFPEFRVALLHGQLKPEEKADVMTRFKRGEYHILVSTTVVEVGVDVPSATVIAVEHAERFGLSQLHQLRGRVGRGNRQSYCFLFASKRVGDQSSVRLEVLEDTNDGFKIAEADLEIRGPGEFLGTRQAGGLPFRLAHLVRDQAWLLKAREDAHQVLKSDPNLESGEHLPLRRYYEREGIIQFERLSTS